MEAVNEKDIHVIIKHLEDGGISIIKVNNLGDKTIGIIIKEPAKMTVEELGKIVVCLQKAAIESGAAIFTAQHRPIDNLIEMLQEFPYARM
jgi:hypothetical protein